MKIFPLRSVFLAMTGMLLIFSFGIFNQLADQDLIPQEKLIGLGVVAFGGAIAVYLIQRMKKIFGQNASSEDCDPQKKLSEKLIEKKPIKQKNRWFHEKL